jgi:hypothetical protein
MTMMPKRMSKTPTMMNLRKKLTTTTNLRTTAMKTTQNPTLQIQMWLKAVLRPTLKYESVWHTPHAGLTNYFIEGSH